MNVSNLEQDILFAEGRRRRRHDVFEALKRGLARAVDNNDGAKNRFAFAYLETLLISLLLFVDYAEAEVDFVGLLEMGLHRHNLRKGFLGMFEGAVPVVKDADAIPQLGFLGAS